MNDDDLLRYSVRLPNGSGCIFQPMTMEFTYILAAKHLFEGQVGQPGPDPEIEIIRYVGNQGQWVEEPIVLTLQLGITYFPHDQVDCAILKIPFLAGFGELYVETNIDANDGYRLCGFPQELRDRDLGENIAVYNATILNRTNQGRVAQLPELLAQPNIAMMSGGGYLKIEGDHLRIFGVQSGMASAAEHPLGRTVFVPMPFFDDIIAYPAFQDQLEPLLPAYLASFSFFGDDIFDMEVGVAEDVVARKERLCRILKAKAGEICNSDITPGYIKDHFGGKLLLLAQQDVHLQKQGIWKMWLELLTILNIAKENTHNLADMSAIFEKVRLFFSDIDGDFWQNHIDELHELDYSGLHQDGIVVVGSNVKSMDEEMVVLDLDKIPTRIDNARMEFEERRIGQLIDTASDFPFYKYTFINISYFKESTVGELENGFTQDSLANCLTVLKELYERLVPDW